MGDPRGGRIDETLWVEAHAKAVYFLHGFTGNEARARECVDHAVARALPGGDLPWDPERYSKLSVYLYYVAKSYFLNERRKQWRREKKEVSWGQEVIDRLDGSVPHPDAVSLARERFQNAAKVFEAVRKALEGDADALAILDLIFEDVLKLQRQVEKLGWPEPRVRNARKRIARAYDKLRSAAPETDR